MLKWNNIRFSRIEWNKFCRYGKLVMHNRKKRPGFEMANLFQGLSVLLLFVRSFRLFWSCISNKVRRACFHIIVWWFRGRHTIKNGQKPDFPSTVGLEFKIFILLLQHWKLACTCIPRIFLYLVLTAQNIYECIFDRARKRTKKRAANVEKIVKCELRMLALSFKCDCV